MVSMPVYMIGMNNKISSITIMASVGWAWGLRLMTAGTITAGYWLLMNHPVS